MSAFTRTLLDSLPAIPGLDESIVIAPRRLHITLGVMSLIDSSEELALSPSPSAEPPKSVSAALALLAALKPRIRELLAGAPLRVALRHVDIMKPDRGDLARAHVLWAGPSSEGEDMARLRSVAGQSILSAHPCAGATLCLERLTHAAGPHRARERRVQEGRARRRRAAATQGEPTYSTPELRARER